MLCILFLESLGLFRCSRKHEEFLFPWDSAARAGNGDLWGEVGGFWEGSGDCFSSEFCQLLLSLWVLVLCLCRTAPKESTMGVHFGDFRVGTFSGGSENLHIFLGCLVAQLKLLNSMIWTELGKSQAFPCCACLRFQLTGSWFPSGASPLNPSLLQTPVHGAWKARRGQVSPVRAFWV